MVNKSNQLTFGLIAAGLATAIITACNIGNTSISNPNTQKYAYVTNIFSNSVSLYSFNSESGLLTLLSPESVATGGYPFGITLSPNGLYAYVVNEGDEITPSTVSMYSINQSTGQLALLPESSVPTQVDPRIIKFAPSGSYAYVTNGGSNTISMYQITESGVLNPLIESTVATESLPKIITFNPAGTYAYVSNLNSNSISMFSFNANNGQLVPLSPASVAAESNPYGITFTPSGKYAYVVNSGDTINPSTISMYGFTESTGVLVPLNESVPTQVYPLNIITDPSGHYAYVVNAGSNSVSMYSITESSGALVPLSESTVATESLPYYITFDPSGQFVYVTNEDSSSVSRYSYTASNGILVPLTMPSIGTESTPAVITFN